jgi:hypothetical protein
MMTMTTATKMGEEEVVEGVAEVGMTTMTTN